MPRKILVSTIVAFAVGFFVFAYDLLTQLITAGMAAILCCVPLLILSRCQFVKSSSKAVHTLISALVCVVSILLAIEITRRL
jgi:small-conductance mechanosensitive channel